MGYRTWCNQWLLRASAYRPRPGVPGKQDPPSQTWLNEVEYVEVRTGKATERPPLRLVPAVKTTQPLHEDVVSSDRPTFAWEPFPGAARYRVRLHGKTGSGYRTFWVSDPVTATRLTYAPERGQVQKAGDEACLSLKPGQEYHWSVDALDAAGREISCGRGGCFRLRQ
jgi:hypothetical protein